MDQHDPTSQLPRHTTPTWEVELLISGVAVFAMLQASGWLDTLLYAVQPRFDRGWEVPLFMTYVYLKGAAVILAITFALHLLLRAQWIAQVGMHSVFPQGIKWERLRIGPIQRELETRRYGSADAAIDRADNRATVLFAIGVMLASNLLLICAMLLAAFALLLLTTRLAGIEAGVANLFMLAALLVVLPMAAAGRIDRAFGDRLRAGGWPRRVLAGVLSAYGRIGLLSRGSNPVFSLLSSHGGERRAMLLTTSVIAVILTCVILSTRTRENMTGFGEYAGFPVFIDGSHTLDAEHYDDQRNTALGGTAPFIQSAAIAGPYLQLTVPYRPGTDTRALEHCETARGSAGSAATALTCLQATHAVALDGKPLPGLHYDAGSDPRTARPALVAMIDVRALAPGRHELRVARPAKSGGEHTGDPGFDRIPFWR